MADKKRTEPDWQDLRVFLALARSGSLSAAARMLGVNHATVARRIQSLEATLGDTLAERRPSGYVLTDAGRRVLSAASAMDTAVQEVGRGGGDGAIRGLVRVNAPPGLALGFLIEHLAALPGRCPGLDIDLATDLRRVSLERHETDVAIRLGRPPDGDLLARSLHTITYGFYGTPDACDRFEAGAEPSFVGFDEANSHVPEAVWLAGRFPHARLVFRANNQVAQAIAARSGAGIALVPHFIGRRDARLRLCRIEPVPPPREIWLLTRRQDRKNLAIRTVVDDIAKAFERERALFAA